MAGAQNEDYKENWQIFHSLPAIIYSFALKRDAEREVECSCSSLSL